MVTEVGLLNCFFIFFGLYCMGKLLSVFPHAHFLFIVKALLTFAGLRGEMRGSNDKLLYSSPSKFVVGSSVVVAVGVRIMGWGNVCFI